MANMKKMQQSVCKPVMQVQKGVDKIHKGEEKIVDMGTGYIGKIPIAGDFVEDEKTAFRNLKHNILRPIRKVRPCVKP